MQACFKIPGHFRAATQWSRSLTEAASAVLVFRRLRISKAQPSGLTAGPHFTRVTYPRGLDKNFLSDMAEMFTTSVSLTMADGTVMPCVGPIHQPYPSDGADPPPLALYRVDGEQFVTTESRPS